ncbi:hypothetical protein ACVGOW_11760 [Pseudonocardia saturnea]
MAAGDLPDLLPSSHPQRSPLLATGELADEQVLVQELGGVGAGRGENSELWQAVPAVAAGAVAYLDGQLG